METRAPIKLDLIEYYPANSSYWHVRYKANAIYEGVVERASDGYTVMRLAGNRAHQIEVGFVYAITINGQRNRLLVPRERFRLRRAEIMMLVEGVVEEWAQPYFDSNSPKHYRRDPDYVDPIDEDAERAYQRRMLGKRALRERVADTSSASRADGPNDLENSALGCIVVVVPLVLLGWFLLK